MKQAEDELRALLLLALAGDNAAYAGFLGRCSVRLRGYFRRRLSGRPQDVEDLVQETLIALHNARNTWRPAEPLTPWLHAIARYKMIDSLRARDARDALFVALDDDGADLMAGPDPGPGEARRDLLALLAALPDRFRLPIVHVKLEGLSVAAVARLTGISESAVKVGIHRGLKALAAAARRRG